MAASTRQGPSGRRPTRKWDQRFESALLQQRVWCELEAVVNRSGRPGDGRHSERPWASALFEIAITKYPGRACLAAIITETLEVVPRQWKVIQTVREKF